MAERGECGYCGGSLGRFTSRSGQPGERLTSKPNGYISVETGRRRLVEYARQVGKATRLADGSWGIELSRQDRTTLARWRRQCRNCGADHVVQFTRLQEAIGLARTEGRRVITVGGDKGDV